MAVPRLVLANRLRRLGLPGLAAALLFASALAYAALGLRPALAERDRLRAALAQAELLRDRPPPPAPGLGAARFLAGLPRRGEASDAIERMFAIARDEGLAVSTGEYVLAAEAGGALVRYQVRVPLHGRYPQIRGFVDRCLETLPSLGLEEIEFTRASVAEPTLDASVRLTLFLARGA